MFTWDTFYYETTRREDEIAQAAQDRFINSVTVVCESRMTRMSIQLLDVIGSKLVQWGERLQCRCAELTMSRSNRAI